MGTVYCGPYAEAIGYHEGYGARVLPDGTETGTWSYATREFLGYRAHCDCGWRGRHHHPATEDGEQSAVDEWDREHLQPLIDVEARRHTVPADVLLTFTRQLRQSQTPTVNDRGDTVLTEHSRGVLHAAEQLEDLLTQLAHTNPTEEA